MTAPRFTSTEFDQARTYGTGPMYSIIEEFEPDEIKAARMRGVRDMAKRLGKDSRTFDKAIKDAKPRPTQRQRSGMPVLFVLFGLCFFAAAALRTLAF